MLRGVTVVTVRENRCRGGIGHSRVEQGGVVGGGVGLIRVVRLTTGVGAASATAV